MSDKRLCKKCLKMKNIDEFYAHYKYSCKICCGEYCRSYKLRNKNKISKYNKVYKLKHKKEISAYNKKYNIENRQEIQKRHTPYLRNRRKTNPQYKISVTLRNRINKLINGKKRSSKKLIGCDYKFMINWFKFQFKDDMNMDNHGSMWHIDHVIPCNKFDLTDTNERLRCFNWTNLQPLCKNKNLSKQDNADILEIVTHSCNVKKFSKLYANKYIDDNSIINYSFMKYL